MLNLSGLDTALGGTSMVILPSELASEPPAGPILFVVGLPFGARTLVAAAMVTVSPEERRKKMPATTVAAITITIVATTKSMAVLNRFLFNFVCSSKLSSLERAVDATW